MTAHVPSHHWMFVLLTLQEGPATFEQLAGPVNISINPGRPRLVDHGLTRDEVRAAVDDAIFDGAVAAKVAIDLVNVDRSGVDVDWVQWYELTPEGREALAS